MPQMDIRDSNLQSVSTRRSCRPLPTSLDLRRVYRNERWRRISKGVLVENCPVLVNVSLLTCHTVNVHLLQARYINERDYGIVCKTKKGIDTTYTRFSLSCGRFVIPVAPTPPPTTRKTPVFPNRLLRHYWPNIFVTYRLPSNYFSLFSYRPVRPTQ